MITRCAGLACRRAEKEGLHRHGGTDNDRKKRSAVQVSRSRYFNRNPVRTAVSVWKTSGFLGRNGDILYLCRGGIGNGVDSACFYQPQTAYGLQSGYAENQQVNYLIKKYTGEALLAMSSCNGSRIYPA